MTKSQTSLPARYETVRRLGQGAGGEVLSVRDRVTGEIVALKVLAENAGEGEVMALVREATALSGLEGLGVPRVLAFGALAGGRRYMVRELVRGKSLERVLSEDGPWIEPLVRAAEQLGVLHHAGVLHGDIKPANIIVEEDGAGTLVDLGLAAPWKEGGARASGLTPKYAAPELLAGARLTVRAEVYALGATLADGLAQRGKSLDSETRAALTKIAKRATDDDADRRHPSVNELAAAIRHAAKLPASAAPTKTAWPVLGIDRAAQDLARDVLMLIAGDALAIEGDVGSGRTTLARRVAWTLGARGDAVAHLELRVGMAPAEAVALAAESLGDGVLIVDDARALDDSARGKIRDAVSRGARLVLVGSRAEAEALARGKTLVFAVPTLEPTVAEELVTRAIPSLPAAIRDHLVARAEGKPGALRSFVAKLGARAVVSVEDVEEILGASKLTLAADAVKSRGTTSAALERALETGRFDDATTALAELGSAENTDETVRFAIARGKIAVARGDAAEALRVLDEVKSEAAQGPQLRTWGVAKARALNRAGDFSAAATVAKAVVDAKKDDALAADALAVRGVALAYLGSDADAKETLERAVSVARAAKDKRAEAVAYGSLAIAHQRAGRTSEARAAYEAALAAGEAAKDAWTVTTTRLNLAGIAQAEGEFASALSHLEAAVDMGQRAGALLAVQQALLNLANLDIYLGRYARAGASIDKLVAHREALGANARAQLLGIQAELAARTGDAEKAAHFYEMCSDAYEVVGRPLDSAEAALEALLVRAKLPNADVHALAKKLADLRARFGKEGFGEHESLAQAVSGHLALAGGRENEAREAFDRALEHATKAERRDWSWRTLDARARLAASQGATALARRDTDAALAILEETASKLPRDLREVFWDDPRRRALRQAHFATMPTSAMPSAASRSIAALRDGASSMSRSSMTMSTVLPAEDRLALIFEITRELAREHDMSRLLERVTDHAIALVGAERGLVVLANDTGELFAHTKRGGKGEEAHASFSRSVAERVVQSGEPVIATSARDDERLAEAVSVHQLMIQSIACVPIRGAPPVGRPIGALYLETRLRPGHRFRDELQTLSAFADQAAIAIENARLLEENRARADQLAQMNEELEAARDRLEQSLGRRTEQLAGARRDLREVRAQIRSHFGYAGLVGTSAPMRKLYAVIDRVKDTDVPVLVSGESGTGKEVVAKAIHAAGQRARAPFLGVNCGAIPENLLESELFGHVRGAFTGADRDRKGLFREAEHGTLLLDEIGELPLKMQTGLLRVLQERTVRPVGATHEEPVQTRVIAATNRDLAVMVESGAFREDLYYRLNVVDVRVPSLRERSEDIPPLIDHFLSIFAARYRRERKSVERAALRKLSSYEWPGNVRQLEHVLLNAWLMSEESEITLDDLTLPETSQRSRPSVPPLSSSRVTTLPVHARTQEEFRDTEKQRILDALARANWNRVQAAKLAGIPRRTFYRRLKEYGIL